MNLVWGLHFDEIQYFVSEFALNEKCLPRKKMKCEPVARVYMPLTLTKDHKYVLKKDQEVEKCFTPQWS